MRIYATLIGAMPNIVSLGEALVEVMRRDRDVPHYEPGIYLGPYPSGAPAIFADAAARLGEDSGFIGVVGDDDFGKLVINRLRRDNVDTSRMRVTKDYTTGIAFVMYYSSGERRFVFHLRHSAAAQLNPDDVDPGYIKGAKVIHIMGSSLALSDASRDACHKAATIAYESGAVVSFDPNVRPELMDVEHMRRLSEPVIKLSKIIMLGKEELVALTGEADLMRAIDAMLRKGPEIIAVKMGSGGSLLATREGELIREPAYEVTEVDPTGAGDVFDAAFIVAWLKGWSLRRALEFANAAGAIKVTRFGPMEGPISLNEVLNFMRMTKKRQLNQAQS